MLKYAVFFTLAALLAGFMGYGPLWPGLADVARIFFGFFLIVAVIFMVLAALGVGAERKVTK
jgi:uncharacterized membrane protein YtjA (UPF0391 family)